MIQWKFVDDDSVNMRANDDLIGYEFGYVTSTIVDVSISDFLKSATSWHRYLDLTIYISFKFLLYTIISGLNIYTIFTKQFTIQYNTVLFSILQSV